MLGSVYTLVIASTKQGLLSRMANMDPHSVTALGHMLRSPSQLGKTLN